MFGVQQSARRRPAAFPSRGSLVGLDIGSFSIKSARIGPGKSGVRVEQVRITPFVSPLTASDPEGNLDRIGEALAEARLGGTRWKPVPVACTLPLCMTQMRLLDAPNVEDQQGEDSILRELAAEESGREEEWLGDYWETPSTASAEDTTPLGIVGARRAWVEELIGRLEDHGLEPHVMDGAPFAIARAMRRSETRPEEVSAALDIGFEGAFFVLLRRGTPSYFRILRGCGTRGVADAIQQGLNINERESHQFLKACSQAARRPSAASKTMLNTMRELAALPLRRLQNELARTLDFARRQADCTGMKRITLLGGGSLLPGMASLLESWADLEFRHWSVPLDELCETHVDSLPLLAQAMALAEAPANA